MSAGDCCTDLLGGKGRGEMRGVAAEIEKIRAGWLAEWMGKLASNETPINPYRVIWELMQNVDPADAIVTHSGTRVATR